MTPNSFSLISLSSQQKANLASLGYHSMTPVQAKSLPLILEGKDIIAQAKTGSGKTAAFGLGLLEHIDAKLFSIQAPILCPTRELADQVASELRKFARCIPNIKLLVLCGGKPLRKQTESLEHGAHIIVGTPGRIKDHLSRNNLDLSELKTLVLDEADRMLDMGFQDEINHVIQNIPRKRQTLLFSATYPDSIKKMCRSILNKPETIEIDTEHTEHAIKETFYKTTPNRRNDSLLALLEHYTPENAVVFCKTKIQCHDLTLFLQDHNIDAIALHGDLEQRERDQVLAQFSNKSYPILVATDVAARGLDIKSLHAVINYELPHQAEDYIHRIGRTGRAGEQGLALSLFTEAEHSRVLAIEVYQDCSCDALPADTLKRQRRFYMQATMTTLQIDTGKKNKIRAGDLLGALTKDAGLEGTDIGKINIYDTFSYVAIKRKSIEKALHYFYKGKVKGRYTKARIITLA